ncbi:MAG: SdpI family protein, partial [Candidatus Norongarragalinales archaeon]
GIAYPLLPERIASHWNAEGMADGFSSKFSLFIAPVIALVVFALMEVFPRYDPLHINYKEFHREFEVFKLGFVAFFTYLEFAMIAFNYYSFKFSLVVLPGFAVLFYVVALLLRKAKRNWFVGIRTPWTLESEAVWNKTHEKAAKIFKALAVAMIALMLAPGQAFYVLLAVVLAAVAYLYWYSYNEWKKVEHEAARRKPARKRARK